MMHTCIVPQIYLLIGKLLVVGDVNLLPELFAVIEHIGRVLDRRRHGGGGLGQPRSTGNQLLIQPMAKLVRLYDRA